MQKSDSKNTWIVVGSSLSAPENFWEVMQRYPAATTITCNGGVKLFNQYQAGLNYYWISDAHACDLLGFTARQAQKQGTKIITMKRTTAGLHLRGLSEADELVTLDARGESVAPFQRGHNVHPHLSGLICLQYALNHQADRVVLVGMDGYRSEPGSIVIDTFDGRMGKEQGQNHTQKWIKPFIQSCIDECSDVEFIYYGKPYYDLVGENVFLGRNP